MDINFDDLKKMSIADLKALADYCDQIIGKPSNDGEQSRKQGYIGLFHNACLEEIRNRVNAMIRPSMSEW